MGSLLFLQRNHLLPNKILIHCSGLRAAFLFSGNFKLIHYRDSGFPSGVNLASELANSGVPEAYGVKAIGVEVDAMKRGENRRACSQWGHTRRPLCNCVSCSDKILTSRS